MGRLATLLLVGALTGCASGSGDPPPPEPAPPPVTAPVEPPTWNLTFTVTDRAGRSVPRARVLLEDESGAGDTREADGSGFLHFSTHQGERRITVTADGFRELEHRILVLDDAHVDIALERSRRPARRGTVRLVDRALADDEGPFLTVGASLFWTAWAYRHDRTRLERNLEWLAGHGFDYIRALGMVGVQPFWAGREIDPSADDYWATVEAVTDLAYDRYGLRVEWVIFADAQVMMPNVEHREAWVDRWAEFANGRREKILFLELANEFWRNGLNARELVDLTARLASQTDVLVASSSPAGQDCSSWQAVYQGGQADIATIHFDRDDQRVDGKWRPVWLPWRFGTCAGLPKAASNNEPIGPRSSVASDDDPVRILSAAVVTFVSQLATYVYHSRAGIRGDVDLWDEPHADEIAVGVRALKGYLPVDLSNWERQGPDDVRHPFAQSLNGQLWPEGHATGVVQAYAAVSGNEFVVIPLGIREQVRLTSRGAMVLDIIHPVSGAVLSHYQLDAGQTLVIGDEVPAVVIKGRFIDPIS